MCKYCKGTGKYQLLNKLVDCDQCHGVVVKPHAGQGRVVQPSDIHILVADPDDRVLRLDYDDEVPF